MSRPRLSVVIPTLNEETYLKATLSSLTQQTFSDVEIIVSDGGSTDNTIAIARTFTSQIIIKKGANVCQSRQAGMELSRAPIIVCADADTIYPPEHLERIWHLFQQYPDVVLVTGTVHFVECPWWGRIPWAIYFWIIDTVYRKTGYLLYAMALNLAFRKEVFLHIGGYNTNLDFGGDELDVLRRLRKKGKTVFTNQLSPSTSSRRFKQGFFFIIRHIFYYYLFNYYSARAIGKSIIKAKIVR